MCYEPKNKVVVLCCRRQRIIFNSLIKIDPHSNFPSYQFPRKYQYPNILGLHGEYQNKMVELNLIDIISSMHSRPIE